MAHVRLTRLAFALAMALVLAIPTQFETLWQQNSFTSIAMSVLNLPGIICMFPLGGRFFPPEGYPGLSISRSLAMLTVQTALWYFVFAWLRSAHRRRKNHDFPDAT